MESIGNNMRNGYGSAPFMGGQNVDFPGQAAVPGSAFGGADGLGTSMYPPNAFGGSGCNASPGGIFSSFMGVMQSFMNQIQQMMQQLQWQQGQQNFSGAGQASAGEAQPQRYFKNASLSSTGDPHDSFSAVTGTGQQMNGKWDSMSGHGHLLSSEAVPGGFNVATQVTAPRSNGVTYNQSATITTDHGNTVVSMGLNGAYSVINHGQALTLTPGETTTLGRGEQVTLNTDGSLRVNVSNNQGGSIATTLSYNGNGVDVNATANNINIGGYLADRQDE